MVRLVNNHKAERIERLGVILTGTHGLDHRNDEIAFNVKHILLDPTDGCSRTKLAYPLLPLVRQEFFVNYDQRTHFQMCRICQCHRGFSKPRGQRQYAAAYFPKRLCTGTERLVLSRLVPELSHEFDIRRYRFDSSIDDGWFAVKPRNVVHRV